MKKSLIIILVLTMLCAALFTGCNNEKKEMSDLEYILDKGTLIVGITDFEPMDFEKDGLWTGFDAELAKLVGAELGVEVQFQLIKWETKETELAAKTIDCIWNGLTYDEDRAKNMSLSDKYMKNIQVVVTKKANLDKYNSAESFDGVSVCAEAGSAGEEFINKVMTTSTYIEKDAQIDCLLEVKAGTSECAVLDYIMAYYLINKEGSEFGDLAIVENVFNPDEEYYAIAFRKGSDITAKVNDIFATLKANGKVNELAKLYGLEGALID